MTGGKRSPVPHGPRDGPLHIARSEAPTVAAFLPLRPFSGLSDAHCGDRPRCVSPSSADGHVVLPPSAVVGDPALNILVHGFGQNHALHTLVFPWRLAHLHSQGVLVCSCTVMSVCGLGEEKKEWQTN